MGVASKDVGARQLDRVRRHGTHLLRRAVGDGQLPDFMIIGAQKAGTTSLHEYLCEHPSVAAPVTKEVHFFDNRYARGEGWYRANFPAARDGILTGESSPYYLFHPEAPARAADLIPEAKLVVLLRNPIDRAFSHHNHEVALGHETLSFEQALAAEDQRLAGEEARLGAANAVSFAHQHFSYLARGRYVGQVERWLQKYDRKRILVLSAEDLFADPNRVVQQAQEFLGLDPRPVADPSARNARSYAPISVEMRADLRERFAKDNQRLYAVLDRDFGWD